MDPLRHALVNHIEILRDFVMEVLQVDSGLYKVEDLNTIIVKPDTIVRLETDWIKGLLELLQMIQQYIQLVERWASHVYGLAQNLGVTHEELLQLERQEKQASDIIPSKSLDQDYLSWIMTDISGEIERLIASTQELTTAAPRLLELTSQYGGPFLDRVQQIGQAWLASERRDFYAPLFALLKETHSLKDPQKILTNLAKYLDAISAIIFTTPMFIEKDTILAYSSDSLQSSRQLIDQLIKSTKHLREFVHHRTRAYLLLVRHQEALMRAVLPKTDDVPYWLVTHYVDQSKTIDDLMPADIPIEPFSLALSLATEAFEDWDNAIATALPSLEQALLLNDLLQSPAIAKFLQADQRRLELYYSWRPRIAETFKSLRDATSSIS